MSGAFGGRIDLGWPAGRLRVQAFKGAQAPRGVKTHHFNHALEVTLPGPLPEGLAGEVPAPTAYLVPQLPVAFFLTAAARELLAAGTLLAVSMAAPIDEGSACCLAPGGRLVLSLEKNTYERLGMQGSASQFAESQHHGLRATCSVSVAALTAD